MNNTGLNEHNCLVKLIQNISPNMENEIDILNHSRYYSDYDFKNLLNTNIEISILNLNCLNHKIRFDRLKLFLVDVDMNSKIVCITLQGTCFDEHTDLAFYSIPEYTLIADPYRLSTHCGVAIYLHDDFSYDRKSFNDSSNVYENLSIEIWRNDEMSDKYLISSLYRPPRALVEDLTTFIDEFTAFLGDVKHRYKKAYICGDMNINLLKIHENAHYNIFYENVTAHGFAPQITLPTRLSDTCDTLIDNIFTNDSDHEHINCVLSRVVSDHQMTSCIISKIDRERNNNVFIEVETINEHTLENFRNELVKQNISDRLNHDRLASADENCTILTNILLEARNKHIPKRMKKFNKRKDKKEKWMTNELLNQINLKNDMYVNWKSQSATVEIYNSRKINFKTYERIVNKNIDLAKKKYYHDTFYSYKNNMKKTWKTINDTLGKRKNNCKLPTYVLDNNKKISSPQNIANTLNNYFANIGTNLHSSSNHGNESYKQYLQTPSPYSCIFSKITENEVLKLIDEMENKSSSGYDCISNKMLKYIRNEISKPLTLIINQMIESGVFPSGLKTSKIIPLHKKGDINEKNNYRPISLLPTMSKIFERIIYKQLYAYFDNNNIMSEQQYGFRTKHSTELAAVKLVDYIKHEIDEQHTPVNIYIDLSKAFDTLNYDILLHKLHYYGVTGISYDLISSYLTDRRQYVKFNAFESEHIDVKSGVPQGSILGPLLFSIYINDLVTVSNKFNFLMYADDTTIYFNLEDFPKINLESHISNELKLVNNWLILNRLSLNSDKTKCMTFHTWQKLVHPLTLSINGKQIENVKFFKFLGVMFDECLSWKSHIKMIKNKLSKIIGIINKLKYIYPQHALLSIYNALFLSHMTYGLLLWGTQAEEVFRLQKKAVRIITNSEYLAHSEPLFKTLELLKIQDLYNLKILKFYYNLSYNRLPSYFNSYLDIINTKLPILYDLRPSARPKIRLPRTRLIITESSLLYQLIYLINYTNTHNPEILRKIQEKSHSYSGFNFNVSRIYLASYSSICTNRICFKCGRL